MTDPATVLIVGGGTGGHIYPGLAVADSLRAAADARVVFVGTARGLESKVVPQAGYELELLDVAPLKGTSVTVKAKAVMIAAAATLSAFRLVRRHKPRVVLSVGGYAAGPVALAARLLGVPLGIVEPNSVVGFTNRVLLPMASRAYVAYDEAKVRTRPSQLRLWGVPIRKMFTARPYLAGPKPNLLIMGGSQGARALNERLPQSLAAIAKAIPDLNVVHQTGKDDEERVRTAYANEKFGNVRVVPYLDDVASELGRASLVVARAGALTVAEIAAVGRPSILIPYPFAADDHQAKNALALEKIGASLCIRQEAADSSRLASELQRLLSDAPLLTRMAEAAKSHGRSDAADRIAADLLELGGIERKTGAFGKRNGHNPPNTPGWTGGSMGTEAR